MQTELADFIKDTDEGRLADSILRKCVHCGFCTATCPTYQILGNELDGPRGRIYLIKQMLEGREATQKTQLHLDRCLTCRACETTCPSGVNYSQLLDIGRGLIEGKVKRKVFEKVQRRLLCTIIPSPNLVRIGLGVARALKFVLPENLRVKIPPREVTGKWPEPRHSRRMIIHQGCIQRVVKPAINLAAAKFLDCQSISAICTNDKCCGALAHHLGNKELAMQYARRNIDAWVPKLENGAEAVVSTASGCGSAIKEYKDLLAQDPEYSSKAEFVSSRTIDLSELKIERDMQKAIRSTPKRVAFHSPCTLQHGQKVAGNVESILKRCNIEIASVNNAHLCCGSAGTYSILQPELSGKLLDDKLLCLQGDNPEVIATANIGCLLQLQTKSQVPVKHWVEIFEFND